MSENDQTLNYTTSGIFYFDYQKVVKVFIDGVAFYSLFQGLLQAMQDDVCA